MSMIYKGKVYRNIQEQVKKNMEDIEELKNAGEVGVIECSKAYEITSEYIAEEELDLLINKFNIIKYLNTNYYRTGISLYQNRYILYYDTLDVYFDPKLDSDTDLHYNEIRRVKAEIKFDLVQQKYKFTSTGYILGDFFEVDEVKYLANLYHHNIYINCNGDGGGDSDIRVVISVIDNNSTPFTLATLHDYIKEATSDDFAILYSPYYPCNGIDNSDDHVLWGVSDFVDQVTHEKKLIFYKDDEVSVDMINLDTSLTFYDKVTPVARIRH